MFIVQASLTDDCNMFIVQSTGSGSIWNRTLDHESIVLPIALIAMVDPGNTKGGSITVPLTSCLTGLD